KALYKAKDYGQYAVDGTIPVAFLSNTDITGGNSGSAVINGKGELIGTAFDGNWEAMSGDIAFEPSLQRTISLDIRYTLFIIDKYAGAKHLVDEMTLVRDVVEAPKPAEVVPTPVTAPPMPPAPVKEKVKAVQTPVKQAKKANAAAVPATGKTVK
ncbi:MAG: S46 family peptidase, partial [Flexibacteraceae bacterium]